LTGLGLAGPEFRRVSVAVREGFSSRDSRNWLLPRESSEKLASREGDAKGVTARRLLGWMSMLG
jgi:hypothetical protein